MGQLRILGNSDLSALAQEEWDTTLRMQSTPADIFGDLVGLYSQELKMIPDAIIMKIPFKKGVYRKTIAMLMNLSGAGVNGRTDQEGAEENQVMKYFTGYSNDYSHGVNSEQYGLDASIKDGWGLVDMISKQLGTWHKEKFGLKCRQALVKRFDEDLVVAPTSRTQHWNRNILMKNVSQVYSANNQPTYSATLGTFTENIGDAITTGGASASWDVKFLNAIQYFATAVWEIVPYLDNRYAVTVPSFQKQLLMDVSTTGTLANLRRDTTVKEIAPNAWNNYLGSFGQIDFWDDPRSPMLVLTGSDGSWVVTDYYRRMGLTDDRPASGTRVDVGFVLGKPALVMCEHEKLHYEEDVRNYGKRKGLAAFRGCGLNLMEWDNGNPGDTTRRNQGSGLLLARRTSAVA